MKSNHNRISFKLLVSPSAALHLLDAKNGTWFLFMSSLHSENPCHTRGDRQKWS